MPKLYLVPTPVGNLEDITLRAIRILKECDFILAEDTRTSGVLLKHYEIRKRMVSNHAHNEHRMLEHIVKEIESAGSVALITDAGTPGISDPGFLIVRECIRKNIPVECLPGATAFIPALVNSGLPADRFCFEGFLPQKKGKQTKMNALKDEQRTMIFYESPYRLVKTLEQLAEVFGKERQGSVSRELSKMFEETKRGTLEELAAYFKSKTVKGEIVIVVAGIESSHGQQDENEDEVADE
jgi:16S rRNA (cytidine1402-2'-O)-methyltransferase